jgi:phosphopantetheine adenylyltransferase
LDVLQQAERLFDKVILASGINPAKIVVSEHTIPVMDVVIDGVPPRFEQVQFNMLLGRFVEKLEREENYEVTIVRGIRDETDVHSELLQRKYSLEMNQNLKYVFLASSPGLEHISSSGIRTLQMFQEDVSEYLPTPTRKMLGYLD